MKRRNFLGFLGTVPALAFLRPSLPEPTPAQVPEPTDKDRKYAASIRRYETSYTFSHDFMLVGDGVPQSLGRFVPKED